MKILQMVELLDQLSEADFTILCVLPQNKYIATVEINQLSEKSLPAIYLYTKRKQHGSLSCCSAEFRDRT